MSVYLGLALVAVALAAFIAYRVLQNKKAEAALAVSTCGDVAHRGGTLDPSAIYVGPDLPAALGGNKSPGQPPHPAPLPDGKPGFRLVPPIGSLPRKLGTGDKLDSFAFKHGPLTGMSQIRLLMDAGYAPGAEFLAVPEEDPANRFLARLTVYFQAEKDDWSADEKHEADRWYFDVDFYVKPGLNEIIAPLNSISWGATEFSTNNPADKGGLDANGNRLPEYNPAGFKTAIDNCCCVGAGFGGDEIGRIHGAFATGEITLDVLAFEVS